MKEVPGTVKDEEKLSSRKAPALEESQL